MFPGYRTMDPYTQHLPHLREHIPSPYHYYPNWEPTPLHMKTDSFNHPPACGPGSYNSHVEHDSCCNHSYPPSYYSFRPPHFHFPHPPQMYHHGPYPTYHDAYPPYYIPPPYYPVDHARFDYDKDKNQCCGCPNHISHRKEGSNVKIEEQKDTPTIDEGPVTMPQGNHSSLIRFPGNHYPMMWLPDNGTRDGKSEKTTESMPMLNFRDNVKELRQGQGESAHQGDNKVLQLPYPIFWLTGNDKPDEPVKDKKEIDATPKAAENWPSKFRIVPLKLLDNEKPVEKPGVVEEEAKTQHSMDPVAEKESKIKTIPVLHLESSNDEKLSMLEKSEDAMKNSVADEKKYDVAIKKDADKKQHSPPKTSKLPPVCLRVEPLPKKNGSNGKGRTSTPPSLKERVKPREDHNGDVAIMKKDSDNTPDKDIKVIDVIYQPSNESGKDTAATIVSGQGMKGIVEQRGENDRKDATSDVNVQVKGNVSGNKDERDDFSISQQLKIEQEREKVDTSDNKSNFKKQVRKNYSPEEAALLIQSAFRGFNVRRWQPLEKLRKISQIRGKVIDVKSQIQNYEGSLELNVKQKVIISETIMNLLLQLDTIQGLLPSLREVRKSVARELVYLQDKLDQLYSQANKEREEGTPKKDENSCPNNVASDIPSTPEENKLPASGSHMKEKNLLEQPSPCLKEENGSIQERGEFSIACEQESTVSDKRSCVIVEDEVKEPVGQSHAIPMTMLNDEMDPSEVEYYQAPQHEDKNDRQVDLLLSAEGKASMVEKFVSQDAVAYPPESEVPYFVLKQQPDADQSTNGNEMEAFKEHDLNDVKYDFKHENSSISLLEQQISEAELMLVKPNEANKQSLFEDVESGEGSNLEEGATIKPEEVIGEGNDETIVEENNVAGEAFVVSEELKPADEGGRSEKCQLEPGSLTAIYPNEADDIEKKKAQLLLSVKEDGEVNDSTETEAELCVESVATPVQSNNGQELVEVSSIFPAVETSIIASTDQGGVDSLEVFKSIIMDNETSVIPEVASETIGSGLKENSDEIVLSASNSIEIGSEGNSTDSSSNETRAYVQNEKSMSGEFLNNEMNIKEKKLVEETEKLRQMLEILLHAGQEQMGIIADINERVKNLEKKLSKRKKVKVNQRKLNKPSHSVTSSST